MKKILILFVSLLSFNNVSAQKYTTQYIADAKEIGLEWWNQVNTGKHEQAYSKLSNALKSRFTIQGWTSQMSMLMNEVGVCRSRIVTDSYFQGEKDGFEDGFYVTVKYDVKYTKTKNHSEDLLLKQNDQFQWQILDFNYTFQNLETED